MAKTDIDLVEQILNEMDGSPNRQKASEVVKKLGKRIRQRHRDRDAQTPGPNTRVLRVVGG